MPSPGPALGGGRDPITGETADLSVIDLISDSISWESVILALLYFVLGYLLYTSVFAAAGATVSDLQDAQQAMTPIVLVIMISLIAGPLLMESPNNRWVVILSMVPPFNAVVMPARVFSTEVPFWLAVGTLPDPADRGCGDHRLVGRTDLPGGNPDEGTASQLARDRSLGPPRLILNSP